MSETPTKEEILHELQGCCSIWDLIRKLKLSHYKLTRLINLYEIDTSKIFIEGGRSTLRRIPYISKVCPNCIKEFKLKDNNANKSVRFCCRGCANKFIAKPKTKEQKLRLSIAAKAHARLNGPCKKDTYIRLCAWDGCTPTGQSYKKVADENRSAKKRLNFLIKFGFNQSVVGTPAVHNEYTKILNQLKADYFIDKLSIAAIIEKYNYQGEPAGINHQFNRIFSESLRTPTESNFHAKEQNRIHRPVFSYKNYQFKTGTHITFDGKSVHYRSSYELEYYKLLDKQNEPYEVEFKYIKYFDTQQQKFRHAKPDIYIPKTNTIIEIKSSWTYDKQNMIDRYSEYIKQHNFKLIYEKKEYNGPVVQ